MITRIWRGWTTPANASAYESLLLDEIFPSIEGRKVGGYRGISLVKRELGHEVEFVTIMWFDSIESVRAFAGDDYEVAVVPPKARAVLARFEERSAHYETVVRPPPSAARPHPAE
jgi:antibiotic biosynthesis monooxygenase (ABM) superfamily enzyme